MIPKMMMHDSVTRTRAKATRHTVERKRHGGWLCRAHVELNVKAVRETEGGSQGVRAVETERFLSYTLVLTFLTSRAHQPTCNGLQRQGSAYVFFLSYYILYGFYQKFEATRWHERVLTWR